MSGVPRARGHCDTRRINGSHTNRETVAFRPFSDVTTLLSDFSFGSLVVVDRS
jgi:hypothetical protein